jgi:hypothetical protein
MSARLDVHALWRATVVSALALSILSEAAKPCAGQPCSGVSIGLDVSQANNSASPFLGEAPGQTFMARDTLLHSLTVWRVASEDSNLFGMHLYITETDSTGYPLIDHIVLDGPTVYNPYGDGVHPIPFQWVFDPPLVLPRSGLYAFFLRMTPCILGYFDVLAREGTEDLYPEGYLWRTARSAASGCILRGGLDSNPAADLIFKIEFCSMAAVPVRHTTWGELKVLYR